MAIEGESKQPSPPEAGWQRERPGRIVRAPFERLCGIEIVEASGGQARLTMAFRPELAQSQGLLHGGALATLADSAVAIAIMGLLPEGTRYVTRDLELKFHAPVREGTVEARASVTRWSDRDLDGEARLFLQDGVPVATLRSRFRIVDRIAGKIGSRPETETL